MRSGLFKRFQTGDSNQDRIQANIRDAVDTLAADHDVISAPINSLVIAASIASGKAINWYRGTPGVTLTLPLANALGANVAAVVIVGNASGGAISIVAAQPNALTTGTSVSVAAGAIAVLVSDGVSKWATESSGGISAEAVKAIASLHP